MFSRFTLTPGVAESNPSYTGLAPPLPRSATTDLCSRSHRWLFMRYDTTHTDSPDYSNACTHLLRIYRLRYMAHFQISMPLLRDPTLTRLR